MVKWLFISTGLWMFVGSIFLLWSFWCFDKIVRILHAEHYDEWTRLGMPTGLSWRVPKEARRQLTASTIARNTLYFAFKKGDFQAIEGKVNYRQIPFGIATSLSNLCFGCGLVCLLLTVAFIFFF